MPSQMTPQCDHLLTCLVRYTGTYPRCSRKAKFKIGEKAYCKAHAAAGMALWYKAALEEVDRICCAVPWEIWEELDWSMEGFLTDIHGSVAEALEDSGKGIILPGDVESDF